MTTHRPRGRRPGESGSRQHILQAALGQFAERGYGTTSIRSVAGAAGVDPSLVTHYFGTKEQLFASSLELVETLPAGLEQAIRGDRDLLPRRLAEAYFAAWEDPATRPRLKAITRAVGESPAAASIMRRFLESTVARRLVDGPDPVALDVLQAMLSQLVGLAFARHILAVEPLASLPLDAIVDLAEPALVATLQRETGT